MIPAQRVDAYAYAYAAEIQAEDAVCTASTPVVATCSAHRADRPRRRARPGTGEAQAWLRGRPPLRREHSGECDHATARSQPHPRPVHTRTEPQP